MISGILKPCGFALRGYIGIGNGIRVVRKGCHSGPFCSENHVRNSTPKIRHASAVSFPRWWRGVSPLHHPVSSSRTRDPFDAASSRLNVSSRLIVTVPSPQLPMNIVIGCDRDFMKNHHHQGVKMATLRHIHLDTYEVGSGRQRSILLSHRARPTTPWARTPTRR